jgi:adenylate kinase
LLFGAPGVGKGTFAKLIQRDFLFKPFSTGDYFRQVIATASQGGEVDAFTTKMQSILASGQFVDDEIVVDIVRNLKEHPEAFMDGQYVGTKGLILDGMPRTVAQAQMLDTFSDVDLVLNFFNKDEVLIQKLAGRRVCPCCNKNFNVAAVHTECGYHMEPLLPKNADPAFCDGDHELTRLITRDDDTEDVIRSRLNLYKEQTLPILDFYVAKPETKVVNIEAKRGKKDYPEVKEILLEFLDEGYQRENEEYAILQ